MTLRAFPVDLGARPSFSDDWGQPRSGGRSHRGTDIFAPLGSPVLAVDDGRVRFATNALGGNVAYLKGRDGAAYYYAHLSGYEGTAPRDVRAGEVIGYVGRTGNAQHTLAHLHFEIHPGGAEAVDPFADLTAAFHGLPSPSPAPERNEPTAPARAGGGGLVVLVLLYLASRR